MIEEQIKMIKRLKENNTLDYNDILYITDAFQIASAQGYAIGKTKGMLDFFKKYGHIHIMYIPKKGELTLKTNDDLYLLFRDIDNDIDIKADPNFESYF